MPTDAELPTITDWQAAVDAAHSLLTLAAAYDAGLIMDGPAINTVRCAALLDAGRSRGYRPRPDAIERTLAWLAVHTPSPHARPSRLRHS